MVHAPQNKADTHPFWTHLQTRTASLTPQLLWERTETRTNTSNKENERLRLTQEHYKPPMGLNMEPPSVLFLWQPLKQTYLDTGLCHPQVKLQFKQPSHRRTWLSRVWASSSSLAPQENLANSQKPSYLYYLLTACEIME